MAKKYWLARVDFIDHADCSSTFASTIPCTVWGLIVEETETHIHVLKWCADKDENSHNSEVWAIVKHKGIRVDKIRQESL